MGKHTNDLLPTFRASNEDETSNTENVFSESIRGLFTTRKLSMKTELTKKQVGILATAEIYAKKYKSPVMKTLIKEIMLKSVSIDRKGRDDIINLIRNSLPRENEESSLADRLFGKK